MKVANIDAGVIGLKGFSERNLGAAKSLAISNGCRSVCNLVAGACGFW